MKKKLIITIPVVVIIAVAIVGIILFASKKENEKNEKIQDEAREFIESVGNKKEQVETLELTAEMIEELEETIEKDSYEEGIWFTYAMTESTNDYEITSFELTNHKKTDKYTYTVYGKLYYKDNYNNRMYDKIELKYQAVKNENEEKGYELKITSWG